MIGQGRGPQATKNSRRLAIIGGGSSGLICLKYARDMLSQWDIVCFEQSDQITGCWGNPYPGFVSTSTKYTTQFACFPVFNAGVRPDGGASRDELLGVGLSESELCTATGGDRSSSWLVPCATVWPMGFSWSPWGDETES